MKYKLLVLDLDGTLTNSKKEVSPENLEALIEAQKQGVRVVLASGRPTRGIAPIADLLKLDVYGGYVLSFNGGQIMNWQTKQMDCGGGHVLPNEVIPVLYEASKQEGVNILSYDNECIVTEEVDNQYVAHEAFLNKMAVRECENFLNETPRPLPKCLMVGDADLLVGVEKKLAERFKGIISVYRSEPFFLELVPLGIDKAESLKKLLNHLGMTTEDMVAMGDGFNDLSMIKLAGLGVAMANAQEAVKAEADLVTLSNDEHGVARVIRERVL
ncbi:MAG: HAD family phosphatase [Bacteroidaceae bacterium]|nr:HAD family phosphatase [Bacteroidaceae bacterium]